MSNENEVEPGKDQPEGDQQVKTELIEDAAALYRRAPKTCIVRQGDVERISSTAFNDRGFQPSVDLARLRNSPEETKEEPTDGVLEFHAFEIRAIRDIKVDAAAKPPTFYVVDVQHRPVAANEAMGIVANPAHSQIEAAPHPNADTRFKKVKEALALIANRRGWLIAPR
jgi:hypothetical protein